MEEGRRNNLSLFQDGRRVNGSMGIEDSIVSLTEVGSKLSRELGTNLSFAAHGCGWKILAGRCLILFIDRRIWRASKLLIQPVRLSGFHFHDVLN
jgi:hypothetical protein